MKVEEVVKKITSVLDDVINNNIDEFKNSESFKVRPGYGYDKFYMDRIEGAYDMSLQSLIHYIMYEDGIYAEILNESQYIELEEMIDEFPESIYSPNDIGDGEFESLQYDLLDSIYWSSVRFVGTRLIEQGFDVKDTFSEYSM